MDKKEIFLKFCKMNGIIPMVMAGFYREKPKLWMYHKESSKYIMEHVTFDNFFKCLVRANNLSWLFNVIGNKLFTKEFKRSNEYKRLLRRWEYFISHNVFIKESSLKIGDEILANEWDTTRRGKIEKISVQTETVSVSFLDTPTNRTINSTLYLNSILEVNNKKPEIKYYIKYKNKVYGSNT